MTDDPQAGRETGRDTLDHVEVAIDTIGALISPWPLALPLAIVAALVAINAFGPLTIGWALVWFSVGYALGAAAQVVFVRLFHRLLDRILPRRRSAKRLTK